MSGIDFNDLETNFPFGVLNPSNTKYGANKGIKKNDEYSYNNVINEIINDRYKPNTLSAISEYIGYVLLNNQTENIGIFNITELLNSVLSNKPNQTKVHVIVRIPELHTVLPIPADENDLEVIKMYPVFSGVSDTIPDVGSLVRVKFKDIYNQTDGIYLGPETNVSGAIPVQMDSTTGKRLPISARAGVGTLQPVAYTDPEYLKKMMEISKKLYKPVGWAAMNPTEEDLKFTTRFQEDGTRLLFKEWPRKKGGKNIPITKIIIHESILDSFTSTEVSLLGNGTGCHFTIDLLGNIFSYNDPNVVVAHEGNTNDISIGIEFLNACYNYKRAKPLNEFDRPFYNRVFYKGAADDFEKAQKRREVLWGDDCKWSMWTTLARNNKPEPDRSNSYVIPTIKMLETGFKLIKTLCARYKIPVVFPGVIYETKEFVWDRVWDCKIAPGINAHHRVEHSDGLFIEHYVICRFNGHTIEDSYNLTKEATKSLNGKKSRLTKIQEGSFARKPVEKTKEKSKFFPDGDDSGNKPQNKTAEPSRFFPNSN
jgi:hypothetical protein